ncbi:MAG: L,D-transpeptidase family protein [Rhodospirillaceae bacterium]
MRSIFVALALVIAVCSAATASPTPAPPVVAVQADYVLVEKAARRMTLWRNREVIGQYTIRLGLNPVGTKQQEGDKRTPEGMYWIIGRNPDSRFHRSLAISYPEPWDRVRASQRGVNPGGDIVIHGLPKGVDHAKALAIHRDGDWTDGCIAVTNSEIEELWSRIPDGTPIEIKP